MKADPEVKMISAEAPILFAKGCDIFITELTMRAWIHAEDNKRRTLQRSDIAAALGKSDMFDFLIDIVPREESSGHGGSSKRPNTSGQATAAQVPQQQPPQMAPPDYGLQHGAMGPPDSQYGRPQMYPGHMGADGQQDPNQGYGQAPQMFGGGEMYNPYTQGQFGGTGAQQVSPSRPCSSCNDRTNTDLNLPYCRCTQAFLANAHKARVTEGRDREQQAGMSKSMSKHTVLANLQKLCSAKYFSFPSMPAILQQQQQDDTMGS
jgi:hypothetical protein